VGISSQQINYFVSVLSFARRTHIHACTPTYVYRDIHTFMHTCMNSYIKARPPHYHIDHRQRGKWYSFIHSIRIFL